MTKQLIAEPQTIMGLSVGDLIVCQDKKKNYSVTPSRIARIRDPVRWVNTRLMGIVIWPYPVFSLTVGPEEWQIDQHLHESQMGYINNIRRTDDGKYLDSCHWELTVLETNTSPSVQANLFAQPVNEDPEPYPFQDGVEYIRWQVWHCPECGKDFNATPAQRREHPCWPMPYPFMLMDQTDNNPYIEYLNMPYK